MKQHYIKILLFTFLALLISACQSPGPKDFQNEYRADYTYCFNKIEKAPGAQDGSGIQFAFSKLALRDTCMIEERGWISIEHLRAFEEEWYFKNPGPVVKF